MNTAPATPTKMWPPRPERSSFSSSSFGRPPNWLRAMIAPIELGTASSGSCRSTTPTGSRAGMSTPINSRITADEVSPTPNAISASAGARSIPYEAENPM